MATNIMRNYVSSVWQLLLNTYILISLLVFCKLCVPWVAMKWKLVSQWIYKHMEVNKGCGWLSNHTPSPSPPSVKCARMFIYIIACMFQWWYTWVSKSQNINISFLKISCLRTDCSLKVNPACVLLEVECNRYDKVSPVCCLILICIYLHIVLYKRRA